MAWLLGDGFDFYNVTNDYFLPGAPWDQSFSSNQTPSTNTRFGTGISSSFQTGVTLASLAFPNSATVWVNFSAVSTLAFTTGGTGIYQGFVLTDGNPQAAQIQTGVFLRNGRDFIVINNGSFGIIATSPAFPVIAQNIWVHVQCKVVIHNTLGSVELRLNGNPVADWLVTGLNTRATSAVNQCNHVYITANSAGSLPVDDFYMFNDQGAQPNTWQGDIRAVQQMPGSDVSVSWTPDAGTSRFSRVNELRENGDTSYVSTSSVGNVDQYGVTPLPITPLNIVAIQTKMFTRMDDAGPHQVKSRLISGATTSDSPVTTLGTNYQWVMQSYPQDPNTSSQWSAAALNAVTIGPVDVL